MKGLIKSIAYICVSIMFVMLYKPCKMRNIVYRGSLLFILSLVGCFAMTQVEGVHEVSFNNSSPSNLDVSFGFFNRDSIHAFGDIFLNGEIEFHDLYSSTKPNQKDITCNSGIYGNKFGANFVFSGKQFEITDNGSMVGNFYLTFYNHSKSRVAPQTLYNSNSSSNKKLIVNNLQVDNPLGLSIVNTDVEVNNDVNLKEGLVYLNGRTLSLTNDGFFTCYSSKSYIITNDKGQGQVTKSYIKNTFEVPIGIQQTMALIRLNMNEETNNYSNHNISFNVDTSDANNLSKYPYRYDEGIGLTLKMKNLTDNVELEIDTLDFGISRNYLIDKEKVRNFIRGEGYITQYIGNANNHGGVESESEWDVVPISSKKNYVKKTWFNGAEENTNPLLMYQRTRKDNIDIKNTLLGNNFYSITTLESTPFRSIAKKLKVTPDNINCLINVTAELSDYYYKDLKYDIYFTNDTIKPVEESVDESKIAVFSVNFEDVSISGREISVTVPANYISGIVDVNKKPLYVKLVQKDKYGPDLSSHYYTTKSDCIQSSAERNLETDPVVYAVADESSITLFVNLIAKYTEEINFKIYNVSGELEADLGSKLVYQKLNNLSFSLPSHISRNQRYLLVISGGVLNAPLTKNTISVFVP